MALTLTLYQGEYGGDEALLIMEALDVIRREYGIIIYLDVVNQALTNIGIYEDTPKIGLGDLIVPLRREIESSHRKDLVEKIATTILSLIARNPSIEDEGEGLAYNGESPSTFYLARISEVPIEEMAS